MVVFLGSGGVLGVWACLIWGFGFGFDLGFWVLGRDVGFE